MQRVQHIQDEQIELQPRQCGQSRQVRDAPVKMGLQVSDLAAHGKKSHWALFELMSCRAMFSAQGIAPNYFRVKDGQRFQSKVHRTHIVSWIFLVAHFNWLSGLLSPAFCCRLFSTALPLQLLATATKAIYTLPAIQIHYIYYIYLSDLNKTLLFWRPVRFAGIMHSGGSLGLGVTAPTRAANNDPFSLSMMVSREIEFCSLVLVLVLVKENPKNKWTYPNLCIWLL